MKHTLKALLPLAGLAAFAGTTPPAVTYHKDVEPIFQARCQECHRPGEIAPFSMLSYNDIRPWAKAIKSDVLTKKMPPWFADPHYGHFSNDRTLTKAEIETISSWVDGGAKEGDLKDAPKPREYVKGWNIPTPDVVLTPSQPFHIGAKEEVPYQYLVMPTEFTEDKWIQMAEARPSDRTVVHHVVVFIRSPESKWLRQAQPGVPYVPPGPSNFNNISGGGNEVLMIYTPGMIPEVWRPGLGKLIKAGSDLVLQIHYTPSGKDTQDQTSVGLVFAKEKPTERALTSAAGNMTFRIPPGDPHYEVKAESAFPNGATILSFFPHMHVRGKSFEYKLSLPDGSSETLLSVPKYDFYWQLDYRLPEPLKLPPGAKIECTAVFDNSPNNPTNPDPTKEVRFGEQSWEEMMFGFYDVIVPVDWTMRDLYTPQKPLPSKSE